MAEIGKDWSTPKALRTWIETVYDKRPSDPDKVKVEVVRADGKIRE